MQSNTTSEEEMRELRPPVGSRDYVLGPEDASVTLLQYGDYECPESLKVYRLAEAVRQGARREIRYVYRHFPLNKMHPHAERAAIAAEAAGKQGKYWEMHAMLFKNQDHLKDKDLLRYADALQLDVDHFSEALEEEAHADRVREDRRSALKNGIDTSSNLFINGRRYQGEMTVEGLSRAIEMQTGVTLKEHVEEAGTTNASPKPAEARANDLKVRETTVTDVCAKLLGINPDVLESVLTLALEIAREGREGRKIGTIFTVGDVEAVMRHSRPLVMDPLLGHPDEEKRIDRPDLRETVKEFAQLDGGFVVTEDGVVRSAARYFDASSQGVNLPLGLGSRHMAGASISLHTGAVAIVVSESSMVRIFQSGEVEAEIVPELWMLRRHGLTPQAQDSRAPATSDTVTVIERALAE